MTNKQECNIVIDLLPSYTENLVSDETKKFVESHLKHCELCKKKYTMGKRKNDENNKKELKEDEIEYDYLKKYKNKMSLLKQILLILLIVILLVISVIGGIYSYKKSILSKIYNNYENLRNLDNYTITFEKLYLDYKTNKIHNVCKKCYYKDGNFKEELGDLFNIYTDVKDFDIWIYPFFTSIKSEKYEGKSYYIIQFGPDDYGNYRQLWVDKENLIIERHLEYGTTYYCERVYTITKDNVADKAFYVSFVSIIRSMSLVYVADFFAYEPNNIILFYDHW